MRPCIRRKSVVLEAQQIALAMELIRLGARLQVLEAETTLSRERLLNLYREIRGEAPPKGMLPFAADWFLTWQPNVHASLFMNFYQYLSRQTDASGVQGLIKGYRLYCEHVELRGLEPLLTFTRAWTLLRFFQSRLLRTTACTRCDGHFIVHTLDLCDKFVCGLCAPPSRAGKTAHSKKSVPGLVAHAA